jgi:hypothetical protein
MEPSLPGQLPAMPATAAAFFDAIRSELLDQLGSTSLAVLFRRAQARAVVTRPGLQHFAVERSGFTYSYRLPSTWSHPGAVAEADLTALLDALEPLLVELIGDIDLFRAGWLGELHARRARALGIDYPA